MTVELAVSINVSSRRLFGKPLGSDRARVGIGITLGARGPLIPA